MVKIFMVGGIGCHPSQWNSLLGELGSEFDTQIVSSPKRTLPGINDYLLQETRGLYRDLQIIVIAHSAGSLTLEGLDLSTWVIVINPSYPKGVKVPFKNKKKCFCLRYLLSFITGKNVELREQDKKFLSDGTNVSFGLECGRLLFSIGKRRVGPLNRFSKYAIIQASDDNVIPENDRQKIAAFHNITPLKVSGGHFCHANDAGTQAKYSTTVSTIIIHQLIKPWLKKRGVL